MKPVFLTIAGSDCSGGAGIQADLKVANFLNFYTCSVITALTVQNSFGLHSINPVEADLVAKQLDALQGDYRFDAIKIGIVPSKDIIKTVGRFLSNNKCRNVVIDPVISPSIGSNTFLVEENLREFTDCILPYASIITPNEDEWRKLCNISPDIVDLTELNIIITGGDATDGICTDTLLKHAEGKRIATYFRHPFIKSPNSHGTGCVFSSALACFIGCGLPLEQSIQDASDLVVESLKSNKFYKIGKGPYGPVLV